MEWEQNKQDIHAKYGFNYQSTLERNQWEYEQICQSLEDGNCDDVINILLADPKIRRGKKPQNGITSANGSPSGTSSQTSSPTTSTLTSVGSVSSSSLSVPKKIDLPVPSDHADNVVVLRRPNSNAITSSSSVSCTSNSCTSADFDSITSQGSRRKPPVLPNRRSVVINLDKNRINLKQQRSKLLPRPISLPSSFNLLKNFRLLGDGFGETGEEKIDIAFIKQLEDEIYKSREQVTASTKRRILSTKSHDNETCERCQKRVGTFFEPNRVAERKTFTDELTRFNEQQQPVLLLDAWQLQPMLMRRDKIEFSDFFQQHAPKTTQQATQSVLIVDNSSFYPVWMKYEIGKNGQVLSEEVTQDANCDCIDNHEQTKRFTRLFQMQMNKLTQAERQSANANCASNTKKVSIEVKPLHSIPNRELNIADSKATAMARQPTGDGSEAVTKTKRPSKLKRFLMQRRKLSLGLKKKRGHTKDVKPSKQLVHRKSDSELWRHKEKPIALLNRSPDLRANDGENRTAVFRSRNNSAPNIRSHSQKQRSSVNRQMVKPKVKIKNAKVNWLLNTRPKVASFKRQLIMRRHSLGDDQYANDNQYRAKLDDETVQVFCNKFHRCSWSCSDLADISNANELRMFCTQHEKCYLQPDRAAMIDKLSDHHKNKQLRSVPNGALYRHQPMAGRSTRRWSTFRLKRHSVGATAMTDVVKAWVYRRRLLP